MSGVELLAARLEEAGFAVTSLEAVKDSSVCVAAIAALRDGRHGRMRQDNRWETDGHTFFAQHRILRWLPEPLVEAEFDGAERRAVERLCAALPELIAPHPPSLTHGDMWLGNILAGGRGEPALIDPAVSCTWPEIDLAELWCPPRAPRISSARLSHHSVR